MMCSPSRTTASADMFAFGGHPDTFGRTLGAMTTLWMAPWRAWCALTIEAMDPSNHARPDVNPRA